MPDLSSLDLDEIATALGDQTDYEHVWLIDPSTRKIAYWTSETGIDGQTPVALDELDLIPIDPLPSFVWYQDMADFAERIGDGSTTTAPEHDYQPRPDQTRLKRQSRNDQAKLHRFRDFARIRWPFGQFG